MDRGQLKDAISLLNMALDEIKSSLGASFHHALPAESHGRRDLRKLGYEIRLSLAKACCLAQRFHEALSIVLEAESAGKDELAWGVVKGDALMGLGRICEATRCFALARDEMSTRKAIERMTTPELSMELILEAQRILNPLFFPSDGEGLSAAMQDLVAERKKGAVTELRSLLASSILDRKASVLLSSELKLLISSALSRSGRPRLACRLAAISALDLLSLITLEGETTLDLDRCLDLLAESHFSAGLAASKAASSASEGSTQLLLSAARSLARANQTCPLSDSYHSTLVSVTKSLSNAVGGSNAAEEVKAARKDPFQVEPFLLSLSPDELFKQPEVKHYRLVTQTGRPFRSKTATGSKHPFGLSRVYYSASQLPSDLAWVELSDGSCRWRQTASSLLVIVRNLPHGVKARDLNVSIRTRDLSVKARGEEGEGMIFGGLLSQALDPNSSTWSIDEGQLVFELTKLNIELLRGGGASATWWDRLLASHPPVDFDNEEKDYSDLPPEILKAIRPNSKEREIEGEVKEK